MYKIAILSSTGGTNFQSILDAQKSGIIKNNVEICCFITNKADCGALQKAVHVGISNYIIDSTGKNREEFDREVVKILEKHQPDLIVLGGYMRIIGEKMVGKYRNKIINIHPSLLPKHPGMDLSVHQEVLDDGDTETGMTIHYIDEGVDTGEIVLQKTCPVISGDTAEILKNRVQVLEKEWYPKVIQMFADGEIK